MVMTAAGDPPAAHDTIHSSSNAESSSAIMLGADRDFATIDLLSQEDLLKAALRSALERRSDLGRSGVRKQRCWPPADVESRAPTKVVC